jgi:hypothetical protein
MFHVGVLLKTTWRHILPLALVSVLALVLGCGSSSQPVRNSSGASASVSPLAVGNRVGNRMPSFSISLLDGTVVTSEGLLNQNRPTFLLFFKDG